MIGFPAIAIAALFIFQGLSFADDTIFVRGAADEAAVQVEAPAAVPAPADVETSLETPGTGETAVSGSVSREAAQQMVAEGAEVEQVSEDEAVARAAAHGLKLKRNAKDSPNYGHPWAIIKTGAGFPSAVNLVVEVYVNDNWSIETSANVTLSYGALLVGPRWHPDALCWGCKGKFSFTLSPGLAAGRSFNGLNYGPGTLVVASGEAEFRYRPKKHFILAAGVRGSGGLRIDDPYTSEIHNPGPPSDPGAGTITSTHYPAKVSGFGDALFYIGVGF